MRPAETARSENREHGRRRWSAGLSSVGIVLTLLFTPEPLRVPLLELDRKYAYHTAGKVYHGELLLPPARCTPCHRLRCRLPSWPTPVSHYWRWRVTGSFGRPLEAAPAGCRAALLCSASVSRLSRETA